MEVAQSKTEQQDYLKNVELARVLEKRAERKGRPVENKLKRTAPEKRENQKRQKRAKASPDNHSLDSMLESVF
jgi:ESF2/ABP1 family protein